MPVLELDGEVLVESMRISERLEEVAPDPPLYPRGHAGRAHVEVFVEWFNEVWKGPPNGIEAELSRGAPEQARIEALGARMSGWLSIFEGLLDDGESGW